MTDLLQTPDAASAHSAGGPDLSGLRVALFSGNYNYVRDGANQALNRLVGYLLRQGAAVRVYAPVVAEPAFPATGDLVAVPALPVAPVLSPV
jgi:phosphatidylinositol alpha 1,6-mannosyltransferase